MKNTHECSDCGGDLEDGFVPDISTAFAFRTTWHRGQPGGKTLLDWLKYGPGVKFDSSKVTAIKAMRCCECGLLKLYAQPDTKVKDS